MLRGAFPDQEERSCFPVSVSRGSGFGVSRVSRFLARLLNFTGSHDLFGVLMTSSFGTHHFKQSNQLGQVTDVLQHVRVRDEFNRRVVLYLQQRVHG